MKCPQCNTDNAAQLLTSWLCINNECSNFDPQHAQDQNQMQLERVRHATQAKIAEMKSDLQSEPDPLDEAMKDYLRRRLQTEIIKEIKELNQAQKDAIAEMLFDG